MRLSSPFAVLSLAAALAACAEGPRGTGPGGGPAGETAAAPLSEEERARQREKDRAVLEALRRAGSNMDRPHRLEHHFVVRERRAGEALMAWGKANGFECTGLEEAEFEGEKYHTLDLVKPVVPRLDAVFADSSLLLGRAKAFGVEYDGWGCTTVK